jgi:hypothetical protein
VVEREDAFSNLGNFKPKSSDDPKRSPVDIDKISQDNNFPSREASKPALPKRKRFRGGAATEQLNIKLSAELHQRFYEEAERLGVRTLGDLIKEGLDAIAELERIKSAPLQ